MAGIDSDSPLREAKRDRLGFAPVADYLARTLLAGGGAESFVLGVEGEWGSGKTSLVNLALKSIESDESAPKVIRFQPWLVGTREALLGELFALIQEKLRGMGREGQRIADLLGGFATLAPLAAAAAEGRGDESAAFAIAWLGKAARKLRRKRRSLEGQKADIVKALKELKRPLVVFIDDLDRLDPGEAAEVLRLVRAVADFPNITYVLAYDGAILSGNLETALRLPTGTGKDYIEKIVQVTFEVPKPEAFDLRNWFKEEARTLLQGALWDKAAEDRFVNAVNLWPPLYLQTPRDVIRALNALRLYGAPQVDDIDAGDMVFLQLLRLKHRELYEWVETYATKIVDMGTRFKMLPEAGVLIWRRLPGAVKEKPHNISESHFMWNLSQMLPGFPAPPEPTYGEANYAPSKHIPEHHDSDARAARLMTSSQHYRYYFAATAPAGSLTATQVEDFVQLAVQDRAAAGKQFKKWVAEQRPQGGEMGSILLDHLLAREAFTEDEAEAVLWALAKGMDVYVRDGGGARLDAGPGAPFGLFRFITQGCRRAFLENFFDQSRSLAWLTAITRSATFDHGYYGGRAVPEGERFFSAEEFEIVRQSFLKRLNEAPPEEILAAPMLASLLYGWDQAGDGAGVREWVRKRCENDEGLVDFFKRILRQRGISERSPTFLAIFFDAPHVRARLEKIAKGKDGLAADARSLLAVLETEL